MATTNLPTPDPATTHLSTRRIAGHLSPTAPATMDTATDVMGRQKVKDSPAYDATMTIDRTYEERFHDHTPPEGPSRVDAAPMPTRLSAGKRVTCQLNKRRQCRPAGRPDEG